jgi:hypothetical protein
MVSAVVIILGVRATPLASPSSSSPHTRTPTAQSERAAGNQPPHPTRLPLPPLLPPPSIALRGGPSVVMESAHKSGGGSTPGKSPSAAAAPRRLHCGDVFAGFFLSLFVRCDGVVVFFLAQEREREPEPEGRASCATLAGTSTRTGTRAPSSGARTGSTAASRRPPPPGRRRAPGSTTAASCF